MSVSPALHAACVYRLYYGVTGAWSDWGGWLQFVLWASVPATAAITAGLYYFGVRVETA